MLWAFHWLCWNCVCAIRQWINATELVFGFILDVFTLWICKKNGDSGARFPLPFGRFPITTSVDIAPFQKALLMSSVCFWNPLSLLLSPFWKSPSQLVGVGRTWRKRIFSCCLSSSNNQPCAKSVPLVFTRASHLPSPWAPRFSEPRF